MARGTFARVRIGIVGFAVASLVGGCSVVASLLPSPLIPPGAPRPIGVEVANGTTLRITIVVDGVAVADIGPGDGTQAPIVADVLGPMPWHVEARTPSGRVLLTLTVNDGDVFYGQNTTRGDAARIDLSCGRLGVWVGPPLIGPMPGPGVAGDCVP